MDARVQARYKARAKVIKALAHPTRLFIIDEVSKGERCVCELTALIGADTSTVSKHLTVLKNAGVVTDEKRGLMVFYRLRHPWARTMFDCADQILLSTAREAVGTVE